MSPAVTRRLLAEFTGSGPLVAIVAGSGIAVTRLTADGAGAAPGQLGGDPLGQTRAEKPAQLAGYPGKA